MTSSQEIKDIIFCKKCVESNQRFIGSIQHSDTKNSVRQRTNFEDGICGACKYFEEKKKIDWKSREEELQSILEKFRKNDGSYDVLIPGSGGKDSIYLSYVLKKKIQNESFNGNLGASYIYRHRLA